MRERISSLKKDTQAKVGGKRCIYVDNLHRNSVSDVQFIFFYSITNFKVLLKRLKNKCDNQQC